MSKSALERLFVIILTVFLFLMSFITVFAVAPDDEAETTAADNAVEPTEEVMTSTDSTVPTTEPIIPADFPALTVTAISNFFPKSSAEYNINTKEVTVTYWLHSTKDVLSVKWYLVYDSEVLGFSLEKNPSVNICPSIGLNSILSFPDGDTLGYCATNMRLFDFSSQDMPFVQLVFDVKELDPDEPVSTKIDLTVEELVVSDIDSATGISDPDSELIIVDDSIEIGDLDPLFERVTKMTTLTASNFVQATSASPQPDTVYVTDASGSIVAIETVEHQTTAPTTSPAASVAPTTDPSAVDPNGGKEEEPPDMGSVQTGGIMYALICLGIISVCTSVLFIMRKKEIMF